MEQVKRFISSVHDNGYVDRATLGVANLKGGPFVVHWQLEDLAFLVLLVVLYPIAYNIKPFQRQFYINDLSISHPFAEQERVSNTALFTYSTWIPLVVVVGISLVITKPANKIYVTYVSALGLLTSVLSTSVITDILKNAFGRHRPDFLARCVPSAEAPTDVLVYAKDVCTTEDLAQLMDGFRTTPSGHSSISFAGLFYLSLWLAGQFTVTRPQVGAFRWMVVFMPTFGAALIALSRTEDYRHHFIDVFVGSCLGLVIATWSYLRVFPSLSEKLCYEPRLLLVESPDPDYTAVGEV